VQVDVVQDVELPEKLVDPFEPDHARPPEVGFQSRSFSCTDKK
jgi:hypothetical protein